MSAPDAVPAGTSAEELAAALRRDAAGDRAREAAVELLIGHRSGGAAGHWLRSVALRGRMVWVPADDEGPAYAHIWWQEVAELLESGHGFTGSPSELAMLRVAVDLATGWSLYEASSCLDPHNAALVVDAVAHAFRVGAR